MFHDSCLMTAVTLQLVVSGNYKKNMLCWWKVLMSQKFVFAMLISNKAVSWFVLFQITGPSILFIFILLMQSSSVCSFFFLFFSPLSVCLVDVLFYLHNSWRQLITSFTGIPYCSAIYLMLFQYNALVQFTLHSNITQFMNSFLSTSMYFLPLQAQQAALAAWKFI